MSLYRALQRYRTNTVALTSDEVYELDDEQAAQIERDSTGTLRQLTDDEVNKIDAAARQASKAAGVTIRPDFTPPTAAPYVADGGGPVMHSGNMTGLIP